MTLNGIRSSVLSSPPFVPHARALALAPGALFTKSISALLPPSVGLLFPADAFATRRHFASREGTLRRAAVRGESIRVSFSHTALPFIFLY